MRLRTLSIAGIGTAALVLASLASGAANASDADSSHVSLSASGHGSSGAAAKPMRASKAGKCGTNFGSEPADPNGIIAWNDTTGAYDNAGAADVNCKKATVIKQVSAYGYFGAASETFHVTVYRNSNTNGSNEPNDKKVICDYPALTGNAGGQYPAHVLTTLKLGTTCKLPKGISWISIQNVDASGPWYWEVQVEQSGKAGTDWVDHPDTFGSGCTVFDNDRYLIDCLAYDYGDWMLKVK